MTSNHDQCKPTQAGFRYLLLRLCLAVKSSPQVSQTNFALCFLRLLDDFLKASEATVGLNGDAELAAGGSPLNSVNSGRGLSGTYGFGWSETWR
jgi:hypothetical protein